MIKVIITFLIIIFGSTFFLFKKNQKLEINLKNQLEINDSLRERIKNDSVYIDTIFHSLKNIDSLIKKSKTNLISNKTIKIATWYEMNGNKTYSGEIFHEDSLIAAYQAKMGTKLKITNLKNQKYVIVRVNDRMGSNSKNKIDLSKRAFNSIASLSSGKIKVSIEEIK